MSTIPSLDSTHTNNLKILLSAQYQMENPYMFDADEEGNLKQIGMWKGFWIEVQDLFAHGKIINAMNDRVSKAVSQTLGAVDIYAGQILEEAKKTPDKKNVEYLKSKCFIVLPSQYWVESFDSRKKSIFLLDCSRIEALTHEHFHICTKHHMPLNACYDQKATEEKQWDLLQKWVELKKIFDPKSGKL